ncbi:hypothetical protein OAX78_02365 [Planctomycetota bacterium]|nr:hypothetical protein [Planctomycetota bacterium]
MTLTAVARPSSSRSDRLPVAPQRVVPRRPTVPGSHHVGPTWDFWRDYQRVVCARLTRVELPLLTRTLDALDAWLADSPSHRQAWRAARPSRRGGAVHELLDLAAWRGGPLTGAETLALVYKLAFAAQLARGETQASELRTQATTFRAFQRADGIDAEERRALQRMAAQCKALADAAERMPRMSLLVATEPEAADALERWHQLHRNP